MDKSEIDNLVATIDAFMNGGGGHMNVLVDDGGNVKTEKTFSKTVEQVNGCDCGDAACKTPTLFEGLDAGEDPEDSHSGYRDYDSFE